MHRCNAAMSDAIVFAEFAKTIPIGGPLSVLITRGMPNSENIFSRALVVLACRCHFCDYWVPCGFIVDYKQVVVVCEWSVEVNRQVCDAPLDHFVWLFGNKNIVLFAKLRT